VPSKTALRRVWVVLKILCEQIIRSYLEIVTDIFDMYIIKMIRPLTGFRRNQGCFADMEDIGELFGGKPMLFAQIAYISI